MDPAFLAELISEYTYFIIVPAAFLFGPVIGLAAGVLLRLDLITVVPTVLALAAGELGGDILWYWLGRNYGERFVVRFGRYVGISMKSVAQARSLFERHHDIILFTSKLTAGLGFAVVILFTAGLSRVPFRRYMMLNIAGQFFWTSGMLSIGYFFGHVYLRVGDTVEKVALFALLLIILASLIGFGRYMRGRMLGESPPTSTK